MKELLPIGSIVLLKGGKKKLMIFGRLQMSNDNQRLWDYISCLYPEGNMGADYCFLFNHEDIADVFHLGYSDDEDKKFLERLLKPRGVIS